MTPDPRLRLVLVTDRRRARGDLAAAVANAVEGGVTAVVLREKDLTTDALVAAGGPVRDACRAAGALFLVAHDVEAARRLAADGVQLGYGAPPVAAARAALGQEARVGCSTHDADELRRALGAGADHVTFSPVWDTPSKRGILAPRGVAALAEAVRVAGPTPVVALGGVTPERAAEVRRCGAAGMAVVGAILDAADRRAAARALVASWESVP